MNTTITHFTNALNIPQKPYHPPPKVEPDRQTYPLEFDYLTRCLHQLGDDFYGYKIEDIPIPTLQNAIKFAINPSANPTTKEVNISELLKKLNLNLIIVGPEGGRYELQTPHSQARNPHPSSDAHSQARNPHPYIIIYRTYREEYLPITTLEKRATYLFYKDSDKLATILLQRLRTSPTVETKILH